MWANVKYLNIFVKTVVTVMYVLSDSKKKFRKGGPDIFLDNFQLENRFHLH
jgi:hypothetical protein